MFYIKILLLISSIGLMQAQNATKIFGFSGDLSVSVILSGCRAGEISYSQRTLISSAIWTTERINFLELLLPLKLGITLYQTCSELDYLRIIFEMYAGNETHQYPLGLVATQGVSSSKVRRFSEVLGLRTKTMGKYQVYLVKATVQFLSAVGWRKKVSLVTTDEQIIDLFYLQSKKRRICINECYIYEEARSLALNATGEDPLVFFGTASDIGQFIANDTHLEDAKLASSDVLFVPIDGDVPIGLPEGSYVILPTLSPEKNFKRNTNILPTPLLLEVAEPLINFAIETKNFIMANCNDTFYKINCLKRNPSNIMHLFPVIAPRDVLKTLKIDPLEQYFVYDIYKVDTLNSTVVNTNIFQKPLRKIASYNIFYDNLTVVDDSFEVMVPSNESDIICSNNYFVIKRDNNKVIFRSTWVYFRTEAWIYAFLSLSLLGILFCIAILAFLLVAISQRRILEGNPVLTLLLLFAVMLVFCSVLPFSIESTKSIHKALCIIKAFSVTMSYAAVFSLLLSRSIVLSSAAKEVGFMSHIAGPVQSFLCLFILGVQAALSLHVLGRCNNMFIHGYDFAYLMSYNTMLLIILLCLTPLIYKSQRNYREGKYFTIAIVLIALIWCVWLPGFTILCSDWKELMLCLGLVSTGSVCLGAIFIPRTYLMTIAAERDKITSALPSLTTAASAVDIYRAHTQPIYDCINVAAINAATVARAGVAPTAPAATLQQPDLYSCPALPEDIDFDICCDSPTNTDKVTRF